MDENYAKKFKGLEKITKESCNLFFDSVFAGLAYGEIVSLSQTVEDALLESMTRNFERSNKW